MVIKTILFDLDETLYPSNTGLWETLRERMNIFMRDCIHIPEDQINPLRQMYYEQFGTTLRGLERDYGVRAEDYLAYVHNVQVQDFIKPDLILKQMLDEIPQRKIIFTNADIPHTRRVTTALGISDCFSQIVDVMQMAPYCKPFPQAFDLLMKVVSDPDPSHYLLIDDAARNVETAMQYGMQSILVDERGTQCIDCPKIKNIHDLSLVWNAKTGEFNV
jgi:putative hydrolase of the HAD superfamily